MSEDVASRARRALPPASDRRGWELDSERFSATTAGRLAGRFLAELLVLF